MSRDRWATFDCYGTLIDWNCGIRRELARVLGEERADAQLERYHELEPKLQAGGGRSYRAVMTKAMAALGAPKGEEGGPAAALPRVGPLSGGSRLPRRGTLARIGVPFELAIVASEIDSYKPRRRHWLQFLEETGAARDAHVHVAQSHYHDFVPANELGLQSIWINRYGEQHELPQTRELADLSGLPDTLDELVAP
jgi:2-haloacid dehalogenase